MDAQGQKSETVKYWFDIQFVNQHPSSEPLRVFELLEDSHIFNITLDVTDQEDDIIGIVLTSLPVNGDLFYLDKDSRRNNSASFESFDPSKMAVSVPTGMTKLSTSSSSGSMTLFPVTATA